MPFTKRLRKILILGFFFFSLAQSHAQWPDASIYHANPWQGGVALSDGSFIGIDAGSGPTLRISKTYPDGAVRYLNTIRFQLNYLRAAYDSVNQRIFLCDYWTGNNECIRNDLWDSARVNSTNTNYTSGSSLICMDTAGLVLWSRRLQSPLDSVAAVSQVVPDGKGGAFIAHHISGNIRQAINPTQLWMKIKPGFYQLVYYDKNGSLRWTRRQYSPKTSAKRATGNSFLVARPKGAIEWITLHADTNIRQFCYGASNCLPNQYELSSNELDSNGTVLKSRTGILRGDFAPAQSGTYYEFVPARIQGKQLYYLWLNDVNNSVPASGVLEFDSTLQLLRSFRFPFYCDLVGGITPFSNNKLGIRGLNVEFAGGNAFWKNQFVFFDAIGFNPLSWHTSQNTCVSRTSFLTPTLFRIPRMESGIRKEDMMGLFFTGENFHASVVQFRFKNGVSTPCRGAIALSPFPAIENVSSLVNLNWQNGGLPIQNTGTSHWKDTFNLSFPFREPNFPLTNICDTLPLDIPDANSCLDSIRIGLNYGDQYDQVRINGVLIPNPGNPAFFYTFRSSGLYTIFMRDSCRLTPFRSDTVRVTLGLGEKVTLSKDSLRFCPGQNSEVSLTPFPGYTFLWETPLVSPPNSLSHRFYADSLPAGTYSIRVSGSIDGDCASADTLVIQNFPKPEATILHTEPDSVLWIPTGGRTGFDWSVNGGIVLGGTANDTLRLNWVAYFQGQKADVNFISPEGCPGKAEYLRIPPSDTVVVPADTSWSPFEFPNLVTKNTDKHNDFFDIKNLRPEDVAELSFYDRWGKKVSEYSKYNGLFPGDEIGVGTYFWSACVSSPENSTD